MVRWYVCISKFYLTQNYQIIDAFVYIGGLPDMALVSEKSGAARFSGCIRFNIKIAIIVYYCIQVLRLNKIEWNGWVDTKQQSNNRTIQINEQ